VNIFNWTFLPTPSTSSPQNPIARNGQGQITGGFGAMDAVTAVNTTPALGGLARTGTPIARFSF